MRPEWLTDEKVKDANIVYFCCKCGALLSSVTDKLNLKLGKCPACEHNKRRSGKVTYVIPVDSGTK